MKTTTALSILAILMLTVCGCAQQRQLEPIGLEEAKSLALAEAGLPENADVRLTEVELDARNGLDYYRIAFEADGRQYRYDVDALTGIIIGEEAPAAAPAQDAPAAGAPSSSAQNAPSAASSADMLSAEEAKAAALIHAGLRESDVTFVRSELERDDGRQVYDLEFYTAGHREYDYDVDAYSGEILSYDHDAEFYAFEPAPASSAGSNRSLSADEAKSLALAQVPGAALSDIRGFETDYDDGRIEYEGTIYYNGMEYEFEIDGYSGAIRSWEAEPVGR